jgi:serine/threonine protein phosphatase PrpC
MTGQEGPSRRANPRGAEASGLHLEVGLRSDRGPSRDLNEDYIDYYIPASEAQQRSKGALFVVADGMGGHQAGEVASKEAVRKVGEDSYASPSDDPARSLTRAVSAANHLLYQHASSDPAKSGMGTTLVAAALIGSEVYVANVGDSRAYAIDKDTIMQITQDHSWVEEQIEAGILTREQAKKHPQRNLITRALGRRQTVQADLFEGRLSADGALFLCTDGVSGPLTDDQIAQIIRAMPAPQAADQLVKEAAVAGGQDNASALIVRAGASDGGPKEQAQRPSGQKEPVRPAAQAAASSSQLWRQRWALGAAALAIIFCLLAAVVFLPALTQKLAGDPAAAPLPAPLQDSRLDGIHPDQIALFLGYSDAAEMIAAHGGMLDPQSLATSELKPAAPGVFLVGAAREWSCEQQECSFLLDMAGTEYTVTYQAPGEQGVDLGGHPVRVYGPQQEGTSAVAAQIIQRGSQWWAWWQPAWELVHQVESLDQRVWVYSIVDRNPNGLLDADQAPGLQRGAQLLLHGLWRADKETLAFENDQVYYLQGSRYVPLAEQPSLPLPTVTLQPTRTVHLRQRPVIESASSGE